MSSQKRKNAPSANKRSSKRFRQTSPNTDKDSISNTSSPAIDVAAITAEITKNVTQSVMDSLRHVGLLPTPQQQSQQESGIATNTPDAGSITIT